MALKIEYLYKGTCPKCKLKANDTEGVGKPLKANKKLKCGCGTEFPPTSVFKYTVEQVK